MNGDDLITDRTLLSVMQSASLARQQSLDMLQFLDQHHSNDHHELPTDDEPLELSRYQKTLNIYLAQLRGLNRKAVLGVRSTKQETAEARQEIDMLHLQLQNLYYEQRHLRGEIAACEDYDHKYTQLPLIPPEDFLSTNPELQGHAKDGNLSEHELMVARIEHEHAERQTLEEQRQALLARKEALLRENTKKKEELGKFDGEVEKWLAGEEIPRKTLEARAAMTAETTTNA